MPDEMIEERERGSEPAPIRAWRVLAGIALLAAFTGGWFWMAGRLTWVQGWTFLLAFALYVNALTLWLRRSDPELLEERRRRAGNEEAWDKVVIGFFNALVVALLVVAALDSGRFRWSTVSAAAQAAAWAGLCVAAAVIWHVMAVNRFLSSMARIQEERGHEVVQEGLYRVVRHPMYSAVILSTLCMPLVLASLWALVPASLAAILFVYRTLREDRMLMEKLTGYDAYAKRVRYRLMPGLW